ncbi:hypothetical protein PM082_003381 [Marasmius tenuissimus]|nr:hypothetical protein PM082_003381 [Marasmius tenuissimus]
MPTRFAARITAMVALSPSAASPSVSEPQHLARPGIGHWGDRTGYVPGTECAIWSETGLV